MNSAMRRTISSSVTTISGDQTLFIRGDEAEAAWTVVDPIGLADAGRELARILLATYAAGLVELHARPPLCVSKVSRFPEATAFTRWRASHEKTMVTAHHTVVAATGETERAFLALLDGTRDLSVLTREMAGIVNQPEDTVAKGIEESLAKLARVGLLIA